jgi:uncharacterized repeat protein (TIGR03837 family)
MHNARCPGPTPRDGAARNRKHNAAAGHLERHALSRSCFLSRSILICQRYSMLSKLRLHLFCRVVDNFGDIGVSWRLARELQAEHGFEVTLWVDHLPSFARICQSVDPQRVRQSLEGVDVRHWDSNFESAGPADVGDVVVEAFGCALPTAYLLAMAARTVKPVWINLEYLSAEAWVEGCHAMQSVHPSLPLVKYFFFPGFTAQTGGLLMEADLPRARAAFAADQNAGTAFLNALGCSPARGTQRVSLFCYAHAPVTSLFRLLEADLRPAFCMVPEGVATEAVSAYLGTVASAGACVTRGSLSVRVIPFLNQSDYDRLLWSCDLNFVRGEDSAVRAQWAERPFVWQIYPQEESAHLVKLHAFLTRMLAGMPEEVGKTLCGAVLAWNGAGDLEQAWPSFRQALPDLQTAASQWAMLLRQNGDLAANLARFVRKVGRIS